MAQKCLSCGAELKRGSYVCDYCGSDWTPDEILRQVEIQSSLNQIPRPFDQKEVPAKPTNHGLRVLFFFALFVVCAPISLIYLWLGLAWSKKAKKVWTVIALAPLAAFLIFGLFHETVYAEKSDTSKISATAPRPYDRVHIEIAQQQIYDDIFNNPKLTRAQRKKSFRDKYEGKWVKWDGKISLISIYTSTESSLTIEPRQFTGLKMRFFFDPKNNGILEKLQVGQWVQASGRLWGAYLLISEVLLADGEVLGVASSE